MQFLLVSFSDVMEELSDNVSDVRPLFMGVGGEHDFSVRESIDAVEIDENRGQDQGQNALDQEESWDASLEQEATLGQRLLSTRRSRSKL